jgi:hypothetical protein
MIDLSHRIISDTVRKQKEYLFPAVAKGCTFGMTRATGIWTASAAC